jgi:hypothetical protein
MSSNNEMFQNIEKTNKEKVVETNVQIKSSKKIRYSDEYEIANQALIQKLEDTLRLNKIFRDFYNNPK